MLNTTTGEFEIEFFFFEYLHYLLKIRVMVKEKRNCCHGSFSPVPETVTEILYVTRAGL